MTRKLHDNGAATPELPRLLGGVEEKSPQDLLGAMARSDLPRNVLLAAFITAVTLGLLTAGPYWYNRAAANKADKPVAAEAKQPAKDQPAAMEQPAKDVTKTKPDPLDKTAADPVPAKPSKGKDPLEKLGVSETKPSNPNTNPLDKTADDLLKDIK